MKLRNLVLTTAFIVLFVLFALYLFAPSLLNIDWMRREQNHSDLGTADFSKKDPEDLIEASIDAYGGSQKLSAIKEISLENDIVIYNQDESKIHGNSFEYYRFPDLVRVDFVFFANKTTHFYDGLAAWTINGGKKSKASDYLAEGLRRNVKHFPSSLLLTALDERSILSRIITENFDDKPIYTLELTDWEGDLSKIWIDPETRLMVRIDYILFTSLGADTMSVVMSDYQDVNGIQLAFSASFYYNGGKAQETKVKNVKYNPDLPDSLFAIE
jgi:outer membrane lipoprotein-sorting protein